MASLKVLLADDSRVNLKIASMMLEQLGHQATIAKNGREAVDAAEKSFFDVILMDVEMPEMDGLEATGRIRAYERKYARHTPVIAMTAHSAEEDIQRFTSAGMDHYLAKPITSAGLVEALQSAGSAQAHLPAPRETDWALDRQQFLNRIGYDKELLTEVIALFGEDAPPKLKQLKSALETGDSQALKQAAHALKGMMGNFAANEAYATAFQLETMGRTGRWDHARETLERLEQQVKLVQKNLAELTAEVAP